MSKLGARDVIALLTDAGSWHSWDRPPTRSSVDHEYAEELACARAKTGLDEAVITGVATIRGRPSQCWCATSGFLGGRSESPPASASPPLSDGPPPRSCRCSPSPPPGVPACRRGLPRSSKWSRSPVQSSPTNPRTCHTSSIYVTPPREVYSPPGAHWETSRSPNPAPW